MQTTHLVYQNNKHTDSVNFQKQNKNTNCAKCMHSIPDNLRSATGTENWLRNEPTCVEIAQLTHLSNYTLAIAYMHINKIHVNQQSACPAILVYVVPAVLHCALGCSGFEGRFGSCTPCRSGSSDKALYWCVCESAG